MNLNNVSQFTQRSVYIQQNNFAQNDNNSTFKIMVATDNHLGFKY